MKPLSEVQLLRAENRFLRRRLEEIASDNRHTRAQRLASAALVFWDAITTERRKAKK